MKRRSFLQAVAGLVLAALAPFVPPRPAAPLLVADEMAGLPLVVFETGAVGGAYFPFFWDSDLVSGVLAMPLLDILVADTVAVDAQ